MSLLCAESVNHLSIPVNDLERAKRFYIPCQPIWRYQGAPYENISLYVIDTEGNLFELVARLPGTAYRTPSSQPISK